MIPHTILDSLLARYPSLKKCRKDIQNAYEALVECYKKGGKVLVCGNGGSAADADHIVGELMKGFMKRRELSDNLKKALIEVDAERGKILASKLQGALPAINLTAQAAIFTAFANDVDAQLVFAQQVLGYGREGDVLIGLSTSGNSQNVLNAIYLARVIGMVTIGFTGKTGGKMAKMCDIVIRVPKDSTPEIQELHLPVYHALCAMVEEFFFEWHLVKTYLPPKLF